MAIASRTAASADRNTLRHDVPDGRFLEGLTDACG